MRRSKRGKARCSRVAREKIDLFCLVIFIKVKRLLSTVRCVSDGCIFLPIVAHMDWGKFRDALDYGHHQLGISEELDNPQMRSEAYLNLARAHERLGESENSSMELLKRDDVSSQVA